MVSRSSGTGLEAGIAMKLYWTVVGLVVEHRGRCYPIKGRSFDSLVCDVDLYRTLEEIVSREPPLHDPDLRDLRVPIGDQDVWAAGDKYYRSRNASWPSNAGGIPVSRTNFPPRLLSSNWNRDCAPG